MRKQCGSFRGEAGLPANALHRQLQAGQILLIVILTIIVASTIGLSLASRSITSLKSSTEEAESQKALSAAEAGIERALQGVTPANIQGANPTNNSNYSATYETINGNQILVDGGNSIPKDEGADLWLSTYDSALNYSSPYTGNLTIYWGDSSKINDCDNSALEIIIVSGSKASPVSKRYAYDPCSTRRNDNHFSSPSIPSGETVNGKTFPYKFTISPSPSVSSGLIARIIPIYFNTFAGVIGDSTLPLQGYKITSTGTSGQASRKLTVFKGYPQTYLPYLSYGLFVAN